MAYLVLERLAHADVSRAWKVLRDCLRWETHPDAVRYLVQALSRSPESMGREDAVLAILKSDLHDDTAWPLHHLEQDDGPVRLLHFVRTRTASELLVLPSSKRAEELSARMAVATAEANVSKVELVLHEAMDVSGLGYRLCGFFHVTYPLPLPGVADIFGSLVSQCVREWPCEYRVQLWHLPFECVVVAPLRALDYLLPGTTVAGAALEAFIACMEAPLLDDEHLLTDVTVRGDDLVSMLARMKLEKHRLTIDALRQRPMIKMDGEWITVDLFSRDFRTRSCDLADETRRLEAMIDDMGSEETSDEARCRLRRILEKWKGVPAV